VRAGTPTPARSTFMVRGHWRTTRWWTRCSGCRTSLADGSRPPCGRNGSTCRASRSTASAPSHNSATSPISSIVPRRPACLETAGHSFRCRRGEPRFPGFRTGAGKRETSVEQRFTTADTPGLGESPRYTRSQVFAEFDWRQSPGYTTSGGLAPAGLAGISSDFIRILLGASGGPNPSWEHPVQAYFRREAGGWRLVGFERLPLTAETFRLSYSRPRRCTVRARACRHEWLKLRV
jgi:hypothetical protein